jgi:hypothetical protein
MPYPLKEKAALRNLKGHLGFETAPVNELIAFNVFLAISAPDG